MSNTLSRHLAPRTVTTKAHRARESSKNTKACLIPEAPAEVAMQVCTVLQTLGGHLALIGKSWKIRILLQPWLTRVKPPYTEASATKH